jgi:hypothetical protein
MSVMDFSKKTILGRTGLKVGRLGVAAGYGAPADAFEEAFERGCNYFYWGSRRKSGMHQAIKNISGQGKRDEMVIVIQSYSRSAFLMEAFFKKALRILELGPLNKDEMERMKRIGDHVHANTGKFF